MPNRPTTHPTAQHRTHTHTTRHQHNPTTGTNISIVDHQAEHETQLADILHRMRHLPYPGKLGGNTHQEHLTWLNAFFMSQRWVATSQNKVIGHVAISNFSYTAEFPQCTNAREIVRLFVDPHMRHKGVGATLLEHATKEIQHQGHQPILMVSDYLHQPIKLYRANGWHEIGSTPSKISNDTMLLFTHQTPSDAP